MDNRRFRFLKNMHLRGFVPAHALQREESEVLYWRRQADLTRFHPAPLRREVKLFMIEPSPGPWHRLGRRRYWPNPTLRNLRQNLRYLPKSDPSRAPISQISQTALMFGEA
jgi:hypothetical protein